MITGFLEYGVIYDSLCLEYVHLFFYDLLANQMMGDGVILMFGLGLPVGGKGRAGRS